MLKYLYNLLFIISPSDAMKRVQLRSIELAAQKMSIQKSLPIQKSIIEEINTNTIDITVSHASIIYIVFLTMIHEYHTLDHLFFSFI